MTVLEAIDYLAALARKKSLDQFDVIAHDSFIESVEVFSGQVKNSEIARSATIGIRVLQNKRPGIAFSEKFTPEALAICLADALSHTQLTDAVEFELPTSSSAIMENYDRLAPDFATTGMAQLTEFAVELEAKLRVADARIENVPYTGASRSMSSAHFLNSNGIHYTLTRQSFSAYTAAVAKNSTQRKMGMAANSRVSFSDLKELPLITQARDRAVMHLGAKPVPSGIYTVLFSNRVSGKIFSLYQSAFFAEVALRGQSRLKDRLGDKIATDKLNLFSIARNPKLPGSGALDGEGVATQDVAVISAGRFMNFLYNLEAAAMEKKNPTGNAVRSPGSKASTGFMNLVVSAGEKSTAELLAAGNILFIDELEGASGCSAVSGEFSIGAQGFLYQDGQMQYPVDSITLNSNFFAMLENIEAISRDYNDQDSAVRVPDLLIGGIAVAG